MEPVTATSKGGGLSFYVIVQVETDFLSDCGQAAQGV
jgi:hypothetical protein